MVSPTLMTHSSKKPGLTHERKFLRSNLNAKAWQRLRRVYADQPVSPSLDLQCRIAGAWLSILEHVAYGLSDAPSVLPDLIFVIGHWRSGTTFLHEMLCTNPSFNFPTTYACMNPQVFPITEAAILQRSGREFINRPMDNMSISLASPQEDEFALLALGAPSPYEGLLFPKALDRGMTMVDPDDFAEPQRQEWVRVFCRFLGQVAASKPGSPVVLKSPTHSYRVKLLSRLFPSARFIHIVRNPFEVYSSTLNMWKKLFSLYSLTDLPDDHVLARQVVANWNTLEEKLDAALPALGKERYVRVCYESLVANPLEELERIYSTLTLDSFVTALPHIENYLATRAHYEKNLFSLAAVDARDVLLAWRHIIEKYGYPKST